MSTNKFEKDEICNTPELQRTKERVMKKQRVNSLFYSISDTFKFLAATCTAIGMTLFSPGATSFFKSIMDGSSIGAAVKTMGELAGAGMAPLGLGIIAAAAVFTTIAISSSYIASRAYSSGNYDALEVNARHTAKNIVKEFKKEATAMQQEYAQNARADGKQWVAVVRPQAQQQEIAQTNGAQI